MKTTVIVRDGTDMEVKNPIEEQYLADATEALRIAMLATRALVQEGKITPHEAVDRVSPGLNMVMFHYFQNAPWDPQNA